MTMRLSIKSKIVEKQFYIYKKKKNIAKTNHYFINQA